MRVELHQKFKEIRKKILILGLVLLVLFVLSTATSSLITINSDTDVSEKRKDELKDTYNTAVFGEKEVPKKKVDSFVEAIDTFITYCNDKNYEAAYEMLNNDYKEYDIKMNTLEKFKLFVDNNFYNKKSYTYQNLSNLEKSYVYQVEIFDDRMLYGVKTYDASNENKLYIVINDTKDGIKLSLNGYIEKEEINKVVENEYVRVTLLSRAITYEDISYSLIIENISDKLISVFDEDFTVLLKHKRYENDITTLKPYSDSISLMANTIPAGERKEFKYKYGKYADSTYLEEYRLNIYKMYVYNQGSYLGVLFNGDNVQNESEKIIYNTYIDF